MACDKSYLPPTVKLLVSEDPRIAEYAKDYLDGTPLRVLEIRMKGALGADVAGRFASSFRPPASASAGLPKELQGTLAQQHGLLGDTSWPSPELAARAEDLARPGYDTCVAHEYLDTDVVLRLKVKMLAGLIRKAKRPVIYAGAGLSTASGIGDYATKTGVGSMVCQEDSGGAARKGFVSPYSVKPNVAHVGIAAMTRADLVWCVVQQNHDGCLQKAGVPQHLVNEIHGTWFDPGNPVVKMDEALREDLFEDLQRVENDADLVLVLGSSLSGMNADRIVSSCALRARNAGKSDNDLGTVIVSLQRTSHDGDSSLRIFATISNVIELLAVEFSLDITDAALIAMSSNIDEHSPHVTGVDMFSVPYDASGKHLPGSEAPRKLLDLRDGSELRVAVGNDSGQKAVVVGKHPEGHYKLSVQRGEKFGGVTSIRYLGQWWVAAAVRGHVPHLPLVGITWT